MTQPSPDDIRARIGARTWFHQIEVAPGVVTPGRDDTPRKAELLRLPADLRGKAVLDVGAYDGYFSFEAERRGADRVLAVDPLDPDTSGFNLAKELLGSQVEHRAASVYDLDPGDIGQFDVVLCLGVLYHLRHPLLALERLHGVCAGVMYVESQVTKDAFVGPETKPWSAEARQEMRQVAVAQFFADDELGHDHTNWWAPTTECLAAWIRSHGFEPTLIAEWESEPGGRAAFRCERLPGALPWYITRY
jgi:tRNA (mo5U34)-methyltransferase